MGYHTTHPIKHVVRRASVAMLISADKSGDTAHFDLFLRRTLGY